MAGNATEVRDRRRPDRAAHEGRDGRRARRPGPHDALVRHARRARRATDLVDTAGHRRRARSTFNVSTTAALIAAGAGCAVAKHGNRSATSRSGSADVLEALGVRIDLEPEAIADCIDRVGFGFMFAPRHHGATRYVVPVRKELAVRTVFNFLGPLTNPAGARRQVIGVSDPRFLDDGRRRRRAARRRARARRARSEDGLDELSISGADPRRRGHGRRAARVRRSQPEDVGLAARRSRTRPRRLARGQRRRPCAASSPASPARSATSPCSTPARRSTSPAAPTTSRTGVRAAEEAHRLRRRRRARSTRCAERVARVTHPRGDRRAHLRGRRPPARGACRSRALEQTLAGREEPRPFAEALTAPGHRRDRRAQALVAVGGHDRRGPPRRGGRRRLRARRRRRAVGPHRGALVRRLARRPARRPRGHRSCRSCARTSSSTPTRSTRPRPRAPTRSC